MTGLDPALLVAGDFVLLRMALVDDLGGDMEAALVLQRIAWRCERDGEWMASGDLLQQETRLSERKVKRAVRVLRERGYLTSRRAASWDPTQVWSVVLDRPSRDGRNVPHVTDETSATVTDETSVTSTEDVNTTTKTKTSAAAADAAEPRPADVVAKAVYDGTGKAVKYVAVRAIAAWALTNRETTPDAVAAAMLGLHNAGKPITRPLVAQVLDGILSVRTLAAQGQQQARRALAEADVQQDGSWAADGFGGWDAVMDAR